MHVDSGGNSRNDQWQRREHPPASAPTADPPADDPAPGRAPASPPWAWVAAGAAGDAALFGLLVVGAFVAGFVVAVRG